MADTSAVYAEDLVPVRSRISWGAITAGSVLALALYFLLTLLGGAVGLSVSDRLEGRTIGIGAAVYAILVTASCLFVGGYVASQLTTGENRTEGLVYGLLVWGVVFAMLLWLMASGVRAGFNTMVGVATAGSTAVGETARNTTAGDWEAAAGRAGVPADQIAAWKERVRNAPAEARIAAEDPANREKAAEMAREANEVATRVTWYTFLGTLVSMVAASVGGYVGSGPTLRLFAMTVSTGGRVHPQPVR